MLNNDTISNKYIIVSPKFLSTITSSVGEINFNYIFDRRDLPGDARLSNIVFKANSYLSLSGTTLSTYNFNYSYWGNPSNDPKVLRLKLDNITLSGNTTATSSPITIKSFSYNSSTNLPARNSQNFDYFGYYKFISSPGDPMQNPSLRNAVENDTKANILTTISDLSGSSTQINYELNNYVFNNVNTPIGGLRVKDISISQPNTPAITKTFVYNDLLGKSTGKVLTNLYSTLQYADNNGITWTNYSEAQSTYYDINGIFNGYSSVKVIEPNGGYTISNFSNFDLYNDDLSGFSLGNTSMPYITSTISNGYKRGLPLSTISFKSDGTKVTEDNYTYASLTMVPVKKAWALHWYIVGAGGSATSGMGLYYTKVENFRLSSTTHKEYDQLNAANFVQTITNYSYCPDKRQVQTISSTDSKNNAVSKTFYHANDASIPMINPAEQTAITGMINANRLSALVHETDSKNGAITQVHNSYNTNVGGNNSKVYLTGTSAYKGNTLVSQEFYNYDNTSSNLVSSNSAGGKFSSIAYGYNSVYPIAKITNANSSYILQPLTQTSSFTGLSGSFTADYSGTITLNIGYTNGTGTYTVNYSLTGPASRTGTLCINQAIGGSCGANSSGVSFSGMPAGSYNVNLTPVSSTYPTLPPFYFTYPKNLPKLTNEFFYEGFEEVTTVLIGNAHTGNAYYNATTTPYQVNYVLPNNRSYVIQWWNWINAKWVLNEQTYTGPRTISGIIDDVRIFPSDALMTTYTYNPLVGATSEINPSGRSAVNIYDGLGRLNLVRDNDRNILTKNCYNYAGQIVSCPVGTNYTNGPQSGVFARNDCGPGLVGTAVTYFVPAGRYTSSISQPDADQQANNEINLNGQGYANNPINGSLCNVPITYNNQTPVAWNFTATNTATNVVYNSSVIANFSGSLSISMPAGTYNFVFTSGSQTMATPPKFTVNGIVQTYSTSTNVNATFTNVSVSASSTNPLIRIELQAAAPCSFSAASPWIIGSSGINASGGVVTFYIALVVPASASGTWGNTITVATVNGGCRPTATRTFTKSDMSGRSWQISVSPSGQTTIKLLSGTAPSTGNIINLTGCSYNL